jgi:hypothetical protein
MNHAHTTHEYIVAYGLYGVSVAIILIALSIFSVREQRKHSENE